MIYLVSIVALWIFFARDFILGIIPVNMDTHTIYGVAKYYFNNLLNGTLPLWEPFVNIGRPFYALSICNLFNPVTQIIPVLKWLGVNYQVAFNVYIVSYFIVTAIGFYWLVKRLTTNSLVAPIGFAAFIFSSIGLSTFTQLTFLEIIAPCVWLLFFIVDFIQKPQLRNALGVTFCGMITVSSYLPFYTLVWLMVLGLVVLITFNRDAVKPLSDCLSWKIRHWWFMPIAFMLLVISALPLLAYKVIDSSGDVVAPGRHCQLVDKETCYERTVNEAGGMLYDEITRSGTLGERVDLGYIVSNLDKINYGSDSLYFIPMMVWLIIILMVVTRANRLAVALLVTSTLMYLIAQGDQSPLYQWLFVHFPLMKYFRNLFFFGIFIQVMVLLAAMLQLDTWLNLNKDHKIFNWRDRSMMIVAILLTGWLWHFNGVSIIQWLTLIATVALLIMRPKALVLWLLVMIIQPIEVMVNYMEHAKEFQTALPNQHTKPIFSWIRPSEPVTSNERIYQFVPYQDFFYAMSMTDAPARVGYPQSAARDTFMLSQHIGDDKLESYARYKFIITDDSTMNEGRPITGPDQGIAIKAFTVNSLAITTHFDREWFLIYNDSYTKFWKVTVDGKQASLIKANQAFKGVWVPKGDHQIMFSYEPPGGGWVYMLTMVILMAVFIVLCAFNVKDIK